MTDEPAVVNYRIGYPCGCEWVVLNDQLVPDGAVCWGDDDRGR